MSEFLHWHKRENNQHLPPDVRFRLKWSDDAWIIRHPHTDWETVSRAELDIAIKNINRVIRSLQQKRQQLLERKENIGGRAVHISKQARQARADITREMSQITAQIEPLVRALREARDERGRRGDEQK